MQLRPTSLIALSVVLVSAAGTITAARADVTLVSTSTMAGKMPGQSLGKPGAAVADAKPEPATTTILIQGHKFRIETGNTVIIYDADTKTRYRINVANKTYSTDAGLKSALPFMAKMLDIKTTVAVTPTSKTRLILGQNAKEYDYAGTVTLSLKAGAMAQAGATPNPAVARPTPAPLMLIKIQGQQWVASVPGLPENYGDILGESSGMGDMEKSVPGLTALSDGLKAIKGYPLASHQSVTMTGLGMAAAMGQSNSRYTVDSTTTTIRQGPLSKALFVIPPGYRKVEPPSPVPGRGMGKRPAMPF